jgi:hypothetical protein
VRAISVFAGNAPTPRRRVGSAALDVEELVCGCESAARSRRLRPPGCLRSSSPIVAGTNPQIFSQIWSHTKVLRVNRISCCRIPPWGFVCTYTSCLCRQPFMWEKRVAGGWQTPGESAHMELEKNRNIQNKSGLEGTIETQHGCQPNQVGWQPPTYSGHPRECSVQPMNTNPFATLCPKRKPKPQKSPPKGYSYGGGHPIG